MKQLGESVSDMLKTPPFNKLSEGDQMIAAGYVSGLVLAYARRANAPEAVTQEMLQAAMTEAVRVRLFPQYATTEDCLRRWDGMKAVLRAALNV